MSCSFCHHICHCWIVECSKPLNHYNSTKEYKKVEEVDKTLYRIDYNDILMVPTIDRTHYEKLVATFIYDQCTCVQCRCPNSPFGKDGKKSRGICKCTII